MNDRAQFFTSQRPIYGLAQDVPTAARLLIHDFFPILSERQLLAVHIGVKHTRGADIFCVSDIPRSQGAARAILMEDNQVLPALAIIDDAYFRKNGQRIGHVYPRTGQ